MEYNRNRNSVDFEIILCTLYSFKKYFNILCS
jgi:hypothetical protein